METFGRIAVISRVFDSDEFGGGLPARRSFEARVNNENSHDRLGRRRGACAFEPPAMAADGWYLGLGGGWDSRAASSTTSAASATVERASRLRRRRSSPAPSVMAGTTACASKTKSAMTRPQHRAAPPAPVGGYGQRRQPTWSTLVYDIPLDDSWKLSLGGGVGGGNVRIHVTVPGDGGFGDVVNGCASGL